MPVVLNLVEQLQIKKLIYAVRTENILLVQKLAEKGVKNLVNYNDPQSGLTALIASVIQNNIDMIQCLLELGAHPDVTDFDGRTALMHAAECGNITSLELLREVDVNPRIQDFEGRDAVFYCFTEATEDHRACLKVLLEMGADVNNRTKSGVPNLVYICEYADEFEDFCLDLIRSGADVQIMDEKTKRTALHNACLSGSSKVVRALLRQKADPNALDSKLSTPAHEAAKCGYIRPLQILSAFGAKFDVYDKLGNNPLHYAVICNAGGAIRFLGQRGCKPKVKNLEGLNPKRLAAQYGNRDVLKSLRKAEQGHHEMNGNLPAEEYCDWKLIVYDYVYENRERIEKAFQEIEVLEPKNGIIPKDTFKKILLSEEYLSFLQSYHLKELCDKNEKNRDEVDYKVFLTGSKYLRSPFLMSAFERRKKKKVN